MRRFLVVALMLSVGCKGKSEHQATRAPGPGADPIAERVKAAILAATPGVTVTAKDADTLVIGVGSGSAQAEMSLDNIRRSCASSETECDAAIGGVVGNLATMAKTMDAMDAPIDKARIRLTPKPAEWLAQADDQGKKFPDKIEDNTVPRTKFVGDLSWVYLDDEPNGMTVINTKQMKTLGLTVEQLHKLAVANLAAQYPKLEVSELTPGLWTIEPGDYLDSARLALDDQWRAFAKEKGGTLKLSVPARSRVFVTNEPKLRDGFDKITHKAFTDEDHPLSEVVMVWTNKGWAEEKQ
ncbi:MAG TPA: hypothetical protein VGM39_11420 [Kofleriaceae bacterium]